VSSLQDVKDEMWDVYPLIKDMFRFYAEPCPTVFAIEGPKMMNIMSGVLSCLDRGESKRGKLRQTDAEKIFHNVNSANKLGVYNPSKALIRF